MQYGIWALADAAFPAKDLIAHYWLLRVHISVGHPRNISFSWSAMCFCLHLPLCTWNAFKSEVKSLNEEIPASNIVWNAAIASVFPFCLYQFVCLLSKSCFTSCSCVVFFFLVVPGCDYFYLVWYLVFLLSLLLSAFWVHFVISFSH